MFDKLNYMIKYTAGKVVWTTYLTNSRDSRDIYKLGY